jgi:octopine/nopaline transport system permease protein
MDYVDLLAFGPTGWGLAMVKATAVTLAVAVGAFGLGSVLGGVGAWAKIAGPTPVRLVCVAYTTVLRGVPDLLVVYLLYFGGSAALTSVAGLFSGQRFVGLPPFATGVVALGAISGAYMTEVFRGAFLAVPPGQIEAAYAAGMSKPLALRRVIGPLMLRHAIPGMGNVWQLVVKESALISLVGLMDIMGQAQIGAGSSGQPFDFYITAALLFLLVTSVFNVVFARLEIRTFRSERRP